MAGPSPQDGRMRYWSAGVEFAVILGVMTAGGYWLDHRTGLLPLWTLIGLAAGFAAALYRLLRELRCDTENQNKTDDSEAP